MDQKNKTLRLIAFIFNCIVMGSTVIGTLVAMFVPLNISRTYDVFLDYYVSRSLGLLGILCLIPLAWLIPMTIRSYNVYKGIRPNTIAFGVCTLIFCSRVSGILLLISDKDYSYGGCNAYNGNGFNEYNGNFYNNGYDNKPYNNNSYNNGYNGTYNNGYNENAQNNSSNNYQNTGNQ